MPVQIDVDESVKIFIEDIISKNGWKLISEVKYYRGSESGDGYASKTIAVEIPTQGVVHNLFLKCILNLKLKDVTRVYENEIYFYDVIYPAYRKFLTEKTIGDGFRNAPKCYGTSKDNTVALENLRTKGFTLFDRRQIMNADHIELVLRTFAKFHAVSFAFKDQKKEAYEKLARNTFDYFSTDMSEFAVIFKGVINDFLSKLNPIKDKHILDKCSAGDLIKIIKSAKENLNEFSIITQGDCWCNNMMFLYEDGNKEKPSDIMLIDWQIVREASPVFDVSYFFFASASSEALSKLDHYLKLYHEELSKRIRQLGSDPDILYPFEILEKEWQQHCRYGFAMAIVIVKGMLALQDELINLEDMDFGNTDGTNTYPKFEMEEEYIRRIKTLAEFMINHNYL